MKRRSLDTHPDVEKIEIELLKQAGTSDRLRRTLAMSSWILWLSKQAIARAHPTWNKQKIDLFFVEAHYGRLLATKLQTYMEKK